MKLSFSAPVAMAGIMLIGAIVSVVIVAWQYSDGTHVIVNICRFFDFDARQVVYATSAGAPPNLNWVYVALLVGALLSAIFENVGKDFSAKRMWGYFAFGLIVAVVTFGHLHDAVSCAIQQQRGTLSYFATGFTIGFTVEELAMKLGRIAGRLGIAH
jgi:hypothetical protein